LGIRRSVAVLDGVSGGSAVPISFSISLMFAIVCSIGDGTALAGLVLLVTRRVRGLRFPRYPGETLFVVLGLMVVLKNTAHYTTLLAQLTYEQGKVCIFLHVTAVALIFLAATIHTKVLRWRLYFGLYFVLPALAFTVTAVPYLTASLLGVPVEMARTWLPSYLRHAPAGVLTSVAIGIGTVCLIVAAVKDYRSRHLQSYPWTHWVGVVLALIQHARYTWVLMPVVW
jgi:hypothetical protein